MSKPLDRLHTFYDRTVILISLGTISILAVATAYYYQEIAQSINSNLPFLLVVVITTAFLLTLMLVARALYLRMIEEFREHQSEILSAQSSLQDAYTGLMEALTSVLDTRDHETHGHSVRVVVLALLIADRIGLTQKQRQAVMFGGFSTTSARLASPTPSSSSPAPSRPRR